MDDFDAELLSMTGSTAPAGSGGASSSTATFSIDDELENLFAASTLPSASQTLTMPDISSPTKSAPTAELTSNSDFLAWLEGTPVKEVSAPAENPMGSLSPGSIENLIDDLFDSSTTTGAIKVEPPTTNDDSKTTATGTPRRNFAKEIASLLASSFVDVFSLKDIVMESGFLPTGDRCKIWNILLNGYLSEDLESLTFHTTGHETPYYPHIVEDLNTFISSDNSVDYSSMKKDILDILALYIVRKGIPYSPTFIPFVATVIHASSQGSVPRQISSSCFYALSNSYLPLLQLEASSRDLAIDTLHFYLRLLVAYHNPKLAQYLDRIVPGWEQPADPSLKTFTMAKADINLSQIDRDLGLIDDDSNNTWNTVPGEQMAIEGSGSIGDCNFKGGLISQEWVLGMFLSMLPLQMRKVMLDWAIVSEEKYLGIFLTASFLIIYGDAIMKMSRAELISWVQAIIGCKNDWHNLAQISGLKSDNKSMDIKSFVTGWIYTSTALRHKTPKALHNALGTLEAWTKDVINRGTKLSVQTNFETEKKIVKKELSSKSSYSIESDDEDDSPARSPATGSHEDDVQEEDMFNTSSKTDKSSNSENLMAKFRRLSMQFQGDRNKSQMSGSHKNSFEKSGFVQDREKEGVSLCLWSDVNEVVPCLTTLRRRPGQPNLLLSYFHDALALLSSPNNIRGNDGVCLPRLIDFTFETPFYFGIDCRSNIEKNLGVFPKTYSLDPNLLTDSDHVAQLLETLEPLVNSVHLCIFGVGEQYLQWKANNNNNYNNNNNNNSYHQQSSSLSSESLSSKRSDKMSLESMIKEERAKINSVAMFFMKKSFCHVSILDGGFMSAIRYLHETQGASGSNLSGVLVDADIELLHNVLGVSDSMSSVHQIGSTIHSNNSNSSLYMMSSETSNTNNNNNNNNSINNNNSSMNDANHNKSNDAGAQLANISNMASNLFSSWSSATSTFLKNNAIVSNDNNTNKSMTSSTTSLTGVNNSNNNSNNNNSNSNSNNVNGGQSQETNNTKEIMSEFTKKLSVFGSASFDTIKKGIAAVSNQQQQQSQSHQQSTNQSQSQSQAILHVRNKSDGVNLDRNTTAFVIDDEDEDDEDDDNNDNNNTNNINNINNNNNNQLESSNKISIRKSELEKQHALSLHKLAGLQKGDSISINRDFLPGAVLFPCMKLKVIKDLLDLPSQESVNNEVNNNNNNNSISNNNDINNNNNNNNNSAVESDPPNITLVHRYLVVTKERFMVLDAGGGGVGSQAIVKSNHHLTELIKMTFRKKDPELVTMFFLHNGGANKTHQYRIPKKAQFIEVLQKNMQKFK